MGVMRWYGINRVFTRYVLWNGWKPLLDSGGVGIYMVSPLLPTSQNILRAFPYVMFLALLLVQYSSTIITHIKYSSVMGHHRRRSQCPLQIQPLEETKFRRRFMNMTVKLEFSSSPLHKNEFTLNYISVSVTKVAHLGVWFATKWWSEKVRFHF